MPNIRQKLFSIVDDYIVAPAQIRNKVAHGQWIIALNRENTCVNKDLTKELVDLDSVVISKWFQVHKHLSYIVEALIESPDKTFHRDYWKKIAELEDYLEETKSWNIAEKIRKLQEKPIKR